MGSLGNASKYLWEWVGVCSRGCNCPVSKMKTSRPKYQEHPQGERLLLDNTDLKNVARGCEGLIDYPLWDPAGTQTNIPFIYQITKPEIVLWSYFSPGMQKMLMAFNKDSSLLRTELGICCFKLQHPPVRFIFLFCLRFTF